MQTPAPDADTAADTTAHAVVEHLEDVRAWCLIRSGDPHLAEDIMQETALAALRQLPTLRDPDRLRGWLFRIAQRRLADAARTRPVEVPLTVTMRSVIDVLPRTSITRISTPLRSSSAAVTISSSRSPGSAWCVSS